MNSEGCRNAIVHAYKAIDKTKLDQTIQVRRGGQIEELSHSLSGMFKADIGYVINNPNEYIGKTYRVPGFLSTGVSDGAGFTGTPVEYRIILPKGTKASYAEPYSYYGWDSNKGSKPNYDPKDKPSGYVGGKADMIVQSNTALIITKIAKNRDYSSGIYIEMTAIPASQDTPPPSIKELLKSKKYN